MWYFPAWWRTHSADEDGLGTFFGGRMDIQMQARMLTWIDIPATEKTQCFPWRRHRTKLVPLAQAEQVDGIESAEFDQGETKPVTAPIRHGSEVTIAGLFENLPGQAIQAGVIDAFFSVQ